MKISVFEDLINNKDGYLRNNFDKKYFKKL